MRFAGDNARWDAIATTLYGGQATNTFKNDHNLIGPAADADTELRNILKGLLYANRRIAANDHGDPNRTQAWINALTGVIAAPRCQENVQPALWAHERIQIQRNLP